MLRSLIYQSSNFKILALPISASPLPVLLGELSDALFGASLLGVSDITQDGTADIFIGARVKEAVVGLMSIRPVIISRRKAMILSSDFNGMYPLFSPNRNPRAFLITPLRTLTGMALPSRRETAMISIQSLGQEPIQHFDSDGDGYGDLNVSQDNCTQPEGYVSNSDDCDDGDADTYPGSSQDGALLCGRRGWGWLRGFSSRSAL